jgi:hypothetical protein
MTLKEKDLLLKDLSARLPYGVCVHIRYKEGEPCYGKLTPRDIQWFIDSSIEVIKPYLRLMSSMTDEERKEYNDIVKNTIDFYDCPKSEEICFFTILIDWLNAHHFDYRGLIGKGLALEAPEGMYNLEKK